MKNQKKEIITILNCLLESNKDGREIYKSVPGELLNPKIKPVITRLEKQHSEIADELECLINKLGGIENIIEFRSQTKPWALLQSYWWMKDEIKLLEQLEATENVIEKQYDEALKKNSLPVHILVLIQKQYYLEREAHNQVRNLRNDALNK